MNPKCVVEPCFPTDKVIILEREILYYSWCFLGNSWESLPATDGKPTYHTLLLNSYLQNVHQALAGRNYHPSQVLQVFCLWTVLCGVFQVSVIMLYIGLPCDELINIPKPKVSKGLAHFLFKDCHSALTLPAPTASHAGENWGKKQSNPLVSDVVRIDSQVYCRSRAGSKNS